MATATISTEYVHTPTYVAQPQNVVIANQDPHPAAKHKKAFIRVGIAQISIGGLAFILGIVLSIYQLFTIDIFGGILYCVSGGLSISIGAKPQKCKVIAGLTVSILVSVIGFVFGILDAASAAAYSYPLRNTRFSFIIGLYAVLSLFGFVQMILAIIVSAFCCMGFCGKK